MQRYSAVYKGKIKGGGGGRGGRVTDGQVVTAGV